ncbi:HPr family phosphocarrier protein [Citroniella saccharovorans]|uniref:Phosphocarrier protein HPr n=1 Tax=Citroniella saccharovorans TaxID=2053367 RepID=A0AAW9MZK9_9FIRM|nr:HPr family phosphocarrier protein [Citroniella saccharovorans]MEB3430050.1 HPr family phosphocarrier protein [Citroniella saccharovorans]
MAEGIVILNNEIGLHARPASMFVREAVKYKSDILVIKNDRSFNAKSIMQVLSMGAVKGDELTIRTSGHDEEEALKNLIRLLKEDI